jgi:glycosyltransferase involved in cell wall biosynthesis
LNESGLPVIVIPCFNEEHRLDLQRLAGLAGSGRVGLLFVDDGSADGTLPLLRGLSDASSAVDVLQLPRHLGKGEAVRRGLLHAVESGASVAGYYDADLATPPEELLRLVSVLENRPDLSFVMAARVRLLGRTIVRGPLRHYLGRVFATLASVILELPVYDTQCGAKVFRVTPALVEAVDRPFRSAWIFDLELIGRLSKLTRTAEPLPPAAFEEMPLQVWRDVAGSKIRLGDMVRALVDLVMIGAELRTGQHRRHHRRL